MVYGAVWQGGSVSHTQGTNTDSIPVTNGELNWVNAAGQMKQRQATVGTSWENMRSGTIN